MRNFRLFGAKHLMVYFVIGFATLLLFVSANTLLADLPGIMIIDIHDGEPWAQNMDADRYAASGNFMTGIDTWGFGFRIERMWFYHGGDYPDSGTPYQVHFVLRLRTSDEEQFLMLNYFDRTTTCNYCWEELDSGFQWPHGLDEEHTFGIFIRPFGGNVAHPYPIVWRDRYPNHIQSAAVLDVNFPPPPGPERGLGSRDGEYDLWYYFSDDGQGEVLLGMEISSDVFTSTQNTNFSTIKALY